MAQQVDDDNAQPCLKCEYDLRGTALDATCPECGTSVVRSKLGYRVDGDWLVIRPNARPPKRCMLSDDKDLTPGKPGVREGLRRMLRMPVPQVIKVYVRRDRGRGTDVMLACGVTIFSTFAIMFLNGPSELLVGWLVVCAIVLVMRVSEFRDITPCRVRVFVSSAEMWARRRLALIAYGVPLIVALPWFIYLDLLDGRVSGAFGLLFAIIVSMVFGRLKVHRHGAEFYARKQVNGEYWMVGCSDSYLRYCAKQRQCILDDAGLDEAWVRKRFANPAPEGAK